MKAIIYLSFTLLFLLSCAGLKKAQVPKAESRNPSSRCDTQMVNLTIKEPVFIPAYDKDGKSKGDVGTSIVFGKTPGKSARKVECTFYNDSGQEISLKKGDQLEMSTHFRPWGPRFYDGKAKIELSCSEEGLDPVKETLDWNDEEIEVINRAFNKRLRLQPAGRNC